MGARNEEVTVRSLLDSGDARRHGCGRLAGEVTGNGKATPIAEYRAGSICAFSGQNDDPNQPGEFEDGRVQSFGDIVQEVVRGSDRGASTVHGHDP